MLDKKFLIGFIKSIENKLAEENPDKEITSRNIIEFIEQIVERDFNFIFNDK